MLAAAVDGRLDGAGFEVDFVVATAHCADYDCVGAELEDLADRLVLEVGQLALLAELQHVARAVFSSKPVHLPDREALVREHHKPSVSQLAQPVKRGLLRLKRLEAGSLLSRIKLVPECDEVNQLDLARPSVDLQDLQLPGQATDDQVARSHRLVHLHDARDVKLATLKA